MSLCDRLAAYFQARPNIWIDGMELATVAGSYAWRSRCADLRKPPYAMQIENKVVVRDRQYRQSYYRYVPVQAQQGAA